MGLTTGNYKAEAPEAPIFFYDSPLQAERVSFRLAPTAAWRRAVLYVGHFWFVEPELETEWIWTGWFTLLAEAESVESAEEKFYGLITLG